MRYQNKDNFPTTREAVTGGWVLAVLLALSSTAFPSQLQADAAATDAHDHSLHHEVVTADPADGLDAHGHPGDGQPEADPHAHHRHMLEHKGYSRSEHRYELPDPALVDMHGNATRLLRELDCDTPVLLNFIFTTCTTICPVLSATFAQVQQQLGDAADDVRMISITIDPGHDTPARLQDYAQRFHAGAQWQFLTGAPDDIVAIQKAFDAYRGSKVNHEPLTFMRGAAGQSWLRIDGLASAADVIGEYHKLVGD